jgi:hypothetical protein
LFLAAALYTQDGGALLKKLGAGVLLNLRVDFLKELFGFEQTHQIKLRQTYAFRQEKNMADANNNEHKDYVRYANHCLNIVPALKGQDDRAINHEMATEWLRLADAALHRLKRAP